MAIRSLRILCQLDFPSKTVRLWDGAGPYMDGSGNVWQGMVLNEGLDVVESALNGEAYEAIAFCIKAHPVVLLANKPHPWLVEWVAEIVDLPLAGNAVSSAVRHAMHADA